MGHARNKRSKRGATVTQAVAAMTGATGGAMCVVDGF